MTDFDTATLKRSREELNLQIATLQEEVERLNTRNTHAYSNLNDIERKIDEVKDYIIEYISGGSELLSELSDIAEILDIELTKTISGTATYEISWSATVPLDFDADDIEINFEVECQTYQADDFEWNEERCDVDGSDD